MTWNPTRLSSVLAVTAALAILPLGGDAHATTDGGAPPLDFSTIWFEAPLPNAVYEEAPADVEVQVLVYQGFDDLGVEFVTLSIDGGEGEQLPCAEGCTFSLTGVEQGMHTLSITADPATLEVQTSIYVDEEPPGGESDSGESDSGETDSGETDSGETDSGESESSESGSGESTSGESGSGGNADTDDGGGGCSVGGDPTTPWGLLALPALLFLPGIRRRRGV